MRALVGGVVALLLLGGCTSAPSSTTSTPTSTPTSSTASSSTSSSAPSSTSAESASTPPQTQAPTAADDLAPFFAEVLATDGRLRAAARAINATVKPGGFTVDTSLANAVLAADPRPAWRQVPPGTSGELLDRVLTVWTGLATRSAAMNRFADTWTIQGGSAEYDEILGCLKHGSAPAAAFEQTLTDLKAFAATQPRVVASTSSDPEQARAATTQAAAELAVLESWVLTGYQGCAGCGGDVITTAPQVQWSGPPTEAGGGTGAVGPDGGVAFTVEYSTTDGWQARINAC